MAPKQAKGTPKNQSLTLKNMKTPGDALQQLHKLSYSIRLKHLRKLVFRGLGSVAGSRRDEEMLAEFSKDHSVTWLSSLLKRETTETSEGSMESREWLNSYQTVKHFGLRGFKLQDPFAQTELARHETKPHPNEVWRAQGVCMHSMCREVESSSSKQEGLVGFTGTAAAKRSKRPKLADSNIANVNYTVAVKKAKQQLMSLAKDCEKQLNNSRRLRVQCDVPGSSNEVQEQAEALRASLTDAECGPAHVWTLGWFLGFAYFFFPRR